MKKPYQNSFTLIELLVVAALISLLSSILFVGIQRVRSQARDAKREVELSQIKKALEFYYNINGKYPTTTNKWISIEDETDPEAQNFRNSLKPNYISEIPKDPLYQPNGEYSYRYLATTTDNYLLCAKRERDQTYYCLSSETPGSLTFSSLPSGGGGAGGGGGGGGASWPSGWSYRKKITISGSSGAGTNYQVLLKVGESSGATGANFHLEGLSAKFPTGTDDGGDLRFTASDGITPLSFWVESVTGTSPNRIAYVWVKVSANLDTNQDIYCYFGNPDATSASKMWDNVKHLTIFNGVFNYNASFGVNGYYSREMQHRLGVAGGHSHTCVLKSNGNVDCYGNNDYGQSNDYTGGDAIGVAARGYHTCVLKSNGNVDCYGLNSDGQANDYTGGDAIGVAAGRYHTCVLKSNGNVDCYGNNNYGQANDYTGGDAIGVAAGTFHTCVLKSNGNVDCYGQNAWGQANDYTGGDAIGVAAGGYHTCVLKSNGNVDCYGNNDYGQANDYTGGDAIGVAAGTWHTCVLKSNGNVDCYGYNDYGLSNDYTGGDAIGVAAGAFHTCVLKSNGNVDCYGRNYYGEANDYTGGDAKNPFRKYTFPEPQFYSAGPLEQAP
jgi:type II secretory pathway pseudopilin PulG